jgi:hypothetical protein
MSNAGIKSFVNYHLKKGLYFLVQIATILVNYMFKIFWNVVSTFLKRAVSKIIVFKPYTAYFEIGCFLGKWWRIHRKVSRLIMIKSPCRCWSVREIRNRSRYRSWRRSKECGIFKQKLSFWKGGWVWKNKRKWW